MRLLAVLALVPTTAVAHPEPSPATAPAPPPAMADRWFTVAGMYDRANHGGGVRVEVDLWAYRGWRLGAAMSTAETSTDLTFNGNITGYLALRDHKLMAVAAHHIDVDGLVVRGAVGAGVVKTVADGMVQPYAYGDPNQRDATSGDGVFTVLEASVAVAQPVSKDWALTAGAVATRYVQTLHLTTVSIERDATELMWMGGVKRRL
ncbi:MAG: hypothetical protein SFX73_18865 [Kofleriaceae bacterium]|nr:hypothetical protein [Kofleriaceae bacterium]